MGNAQTRRSSRRKPQDFYFDQLPPELRYALAHAAFTYDAKWFLDHWKRGHSIAFLIQALKKADSDRATKFVPYEVNFKTKKYKTAYFYEESRVPILYPAGM